MRLWVRLAILLLLAAVIPLAGAGALTLRLLEETARKDAATRHHALAELSASLVRDYIARANEKLTTVSRLLADELTHKKVGDWNAGNDDYRNTVLARLNTLVEPPDIYLELQYYAAGANLQFVDRAQQNDYRQKQTSTPQYREQQMEQIVTNTGNRVMQEMMSQGQSWVAPQTEQNYGFTCLPISAPVIREKTSYGALVAYVDFRQIQRLLENVAQSRYYVRLEDGAHRILAGTPTPPGETVGVQIPAGHSDWSLFVAEETDRIYAATGELRTSALLFLGIAFFLAVTLGITTASTIVRPVASLTRTAERMEAGDLKARSGISSRDEIGRLGHAFDRMAATLEKLDESKSEFVANVSHELRTPLTSLRLSIANLQEGLLGPVESRQQEVLGRLRGDVERLIRMVNDLLEMARLEAGAVAPRREPLDLGELARNCVSSLEPLAHEKRIRISVEGAGTAQADRTMIQRVVGNLLDNAIKFTPAGGTVTVTLSDRQIRIADTGPGIALERPFEKFSQGSQEGVKNRGVGLGLAIVQKLVDLHGGTIRMENQGGAVFTVTL